MTQKIGELQVKQFTWDVVDSNSFFIKEGNHGMLIDVVDSEELYRAIEPLNTLTVILTHSHFDHICGLNRVRELKPDSTVYATKQCSINIGNKYKNLSSSANAFMAFYNKNLFSGTIKSICCKPANIIFENQIMFSWQNYEITLTAFYGHTNDSLIAVLDKKYAFSGDTILPIPTVTRFPGGSTARFWKEDIPKLKQMEIEKVFPGHGEPGKLEDMLSVNFKPEM